MAFTCGFFNSVSGDRKYNSRQLSQLFDGIIVDGVFAHYGSHFAITPISGYNINVGSGRFWFNHVWGLNDGNTTVTVAPADISAPRIDAIVAEINLSDSVRNAFIKVVPGTPNGGKPTLTKANNLFQYPFAYVTVPAGATSVTASNIEVKVGTSECPFATGVLESVDIDNLFDQWEGQFTEWFSGVQSQLEGNIATNLINEINQLKTNKADKTSVPTANTSLAKTGDIISSITGIDSLQASKYLKCDGAKVNLNSYPLIKNTNIADAICGDATYIANLAGQTIYHVDDTKVIYTYGSSSSGYYLCSYDLLTGETKQIQYYSGQVNSNIFSYGSYYITVILESGTWKYKKIPNTLSSIPSSWTNIGSISSVPNMRSLVISYNNVVYLFAVGYGVNAPGGSSTILYPTLYSSNDGFSSSISDTFSNGSTFSGKSLEYENCFVYNNYLYIWYRVFSGSTIYQQSYIVKINCSTRKIEKAYLTSTSSTSISGTTSSSHSMKTYHFMHGNIIFRLYGLYDNTSTNNVDKLYSLFIETINLETDARNSVAQIYPSAYIRGDIADADLNGFRVISIPGNEKNVAIHTMNYSGNITNTINIKDAYSNDIIRGLYIPFSRNSQGYRDVYVPFVTNNYYANINTPIQDTQYSNYVIFNLRKYAKAMSSSSSVENFHELRVVNILTGISHILMDSVHASNAMDSGSDHTYGRMLYTSNGSIGYLLYPIVSSSVCVIKFNRDSMTRQLPVIPGAYIKALN